MKLLNTISKHYFYDYLELGVVTPTGFNRSAWLLKHSQFSLAGSGAGGFWLLPWLVKSQEVIILKTLPLRAIQTKA